ncbi:MAG: sporulation integral membrane protein YtvI [Clostridia bacterium]
MTQVRYNKKYILKMLLFVLGIGVVLFLLFKLSLFLAPFIIAFAISLLIEPIVRFLNKKLKTPRKIASALAILCVISTVGTLLTLLIVRLSREIADISQYLPKYFTILYDEANAIGAKLTNMFLIMPPEVVKNIQGLLTGLTQGLGSFVKSLATGIVNTAISLPEAFIFVIVTIVATYFFSSDKEKIYFYIKSHLPDSWMKRASSIKLDLFSALFGYLKAQLIMMSITFVELLIGFAIIGVPYTLLLALLVSLIDALPILGTGSILIPWAIYKFITQDIRMGTSLIVLYLIVLAVRQLIEPKVLSKQIGLHPLVTLITMYTGLQLFGFFGLILAPITVLVLKNIFTGMVKSSAVKEFLNQIRVPENKYNDL